VEFTDNLIKRFKEFNLTEKDLILVVVCGGGSAMLIHPYKISLEKKIKVGEALLESGADIIEINTIRQHLSTVKGGGLAEILYPARVASVIFSDVPGNNLSYIASGPTVKDDTTIDNAISLLKKYNLMDKLGLSREDFSENPREDKYFEKVSNILVLSNLTALNAMKKKAEELGFKAEVLSDKFEGEARTVGRELIEKTGNHSILLVGGETTVKVVGKGEGGRNQEVVLGALSFIDEKTIICSFDSDGWDNSPFAGAIGDTKTLEKAKELGINPLEFLNSNNSLLFFQKTED
jgi:glycerate-2-kinase